MRVFHGLESARFAGVVLTIGNFDGVHRGHQAILAAGRRRAEAIGTELVAMTFDPHPAAILVPDRVPATLTPLPEKLRCLAQHGAQATAVVRSEPTFFQRTPEAFVSEVIAARFQPAVVVEGSSFRFGLHRRGDNETLRAAGAEHGFEVEVLDPIRVGLGGHPDTAISSSLIRQLLASGTVDQAGACLGRAYALFGSVREGARRGRQLGFPTANLATEDQLIPASGVYAGRAHVQAGWFPAAVSIGRNPTFSGDETVVEAHLLDFAGDLYGQTIRIELHAWIRGQAKFASSEELQHQIERDVEQVKAAVQT